jgi:hypothetical protein
MSPKRDKTVAELVEKYIREHPRHSRPELRHLIRVDHQELFGSIDKSAGTNLRKLDRCLKKAFSGKTEPVGGPSRETVLNVPKRVRGHTRRVLDKLGLGLEAILLEGGCLWLSDETLDSQLRTRLREKVESNERDNKDYAEEHLRTGYPHIYEEVENWRGHAKIILRQLAEEGYSEADANSIVNYVTIAGGDDLEISEQVRQLLETRGNLYFTLSGHIMELMHRIENGKNLEGTCELCR